MTQHLTPFAVCERLIGKPQKIAAAIGMNEKSPFHWRHARTGRIAGDLPSATVMRALLDHSEAHALGLTATHLIRGASEAEVAAILAARSDLSGQPQAMQAAE